MPYRVHTAKIPGLATGLVAGLLDRWLSFFNQPMRNLREVRREDLRPDLLAGLTVALVGLPQAIAYAAIANLPPHYGLYAAIVASIVGSLWGSSRHLSTGPTNAASLLLLSILAPVVAPDAPAFLVAASLMAVLVGLFRIGFGLAGLGLLVNFVSRGVLLGFTAGAGALIAVNQLRHLLKLPLGASAGTFSILAAAIDPVQSHWPSLVLGLATVALTLCVNRCLPRLPGSLVGLIAATGAVVWIGADRLGVQVVGAIPSALPQPTDLAAVWELIRSGTPRSLLTGALAIALLGLVEAVSIARTIARSTGQRLDVDQEFVGQGLANVAAGLFSGYTCSGSFTRSAVNYQAGARTAMAGVFAGLFVLVGTLLAAPWLASLPRAGLAGVLMLVAWGMIDRASIARVLRTSTAESAVMIVTFLATLLVPLEFAVLSGVLFSLGMYLYRSSLPRVVAVVPDPTFRHFVEHEDAPECSQVAVMNLRGPLYFGATQHVEHALLALLDEKPPRRWLLLRLHGVDQCDYTGIEMLETVVQAFRAAGGDVFVVQVRPPVRAIMASSGFLELLGEDHVLAQEAAIDYLFEEVIDPAVCWYVCRSRIFAECQAIAKHPQEITIPPHRPRRVEPWRTLAVDQAEALIAEHNPLVLDVREPDEYEHGHLRQALALPLARLFSEPPELPRDRPLLLVCRSGRRSLRGLRLLLELGYEEVYALKGGILSWKATDRPLEVD